jgi:hypothetical protein
MADKYLGIGSDGLPTEVEGKVTSAGAGDAGKIPALDSSGKLDTTLMPAGVGQNVSSIVASEALAAGDYVNIWNDAGAVKVRKADNSNARRAHGFVRASVAMAATATVYGAGELNDQRTGLTLGSEYFLGTAGGVVTAAPTAAGSIVQAVGVAESATAIRFTPTLPMKRV